MGKSASNIAVQLRKAVADDLPAIRDIYNYYVSRSTATFAEEEESLDERRLWFKNHQENSLPVIVCESEGQVVGWGSLSLYHQRCAYRRSLEPSIYIHHDYLRHGLGRKIIDELIELARQCGCHNMVCLVCSENEASLKLLGELGFEKIGVLNEVGRKFDRWLDVTILQQLIKE